MCNKFYIVYFYAQEVEKQLITLYKNKEWLFEQYITRGRTIRSIQEECGVSHNTIETYLKKYNIRKREKSPKIPTRDELLSLHNEQAYGIYKIASLYPGVGANTIIKLMNSYGLRIINANDLKKMWWKKECNKKRMSDMRKTLWKDTEYIQKTSEHLHDRDCMQNRSIKFSAKYQGVSLDDWKGFITSDNARARFNNQYKEWRRKVFERDGYTCQCCGAKSYKGHPVVLNAHHLDGFANNIELRYDVDNGITLCRDCHNVHTPGSFHNIFGVRNNSREQYEEYLSMRSNLDK